MIIPLHDNVWTVWADVLDKFRRMPRCYGWAFLVQPDTCAGVILLQDCVDHSEIIELSVFSDYRRRGIASKLLEQALVELPENLSKNSNFEGFENGLIGNDSQKAHEKHNEQRRILLEVAENNYPAIALYEKYAFQQIGRRAKYYGSTDALVMERDICERADE